jgi:hypothetical protein
MARRWPLRTAAVGFRASYDPGGIELNISWRWWAHLEQWRATVEDADGGVLFASIPVSIGADLFLDRTLPGLPPGRLRVGGPRHLDLDAKDQLAACELMYLPDSEPSP